MKTKPLLYKVGIWFWSGTRHWWLRFCS